MACEALPAGAGFISSITTYLDCQAHLLGTGAWQTLAAPGSTFSVVLSGFLTIFIALIGYNLLFGNSLTVRSGTLAFVKIGAVLALATSWPAYRTMVYDLVTAGPVQLVAEIGTQAAVAGADGKLLQRLDLTDQALGQLAILGAGNPIGPQATLPPPPWAGFNAFALGGSRILFLLTVVAGLGAVRIVAALMLALGPFFIAFLLFDSTRSLFVGWVRVLAGAGLAAIGIAIALGLELALMEPWLSTVLARRMAGEALPNLPAELVVITTVFAIIAIASIIACARVAQAFHLPPIPLVWQVGGEPIIRRPTEVRPDAARRADRVEGSHGRAAAVAAVLSTMSHRSAARDNAPIRPDAISSRHLVTVGSASRGAPNSATPVGRSFTRRTGSRVSAGANRRDALA